MPLASLFQVAAMVFAATSLVVFGDTAGKLLTGGGASPVFVAWSRFVLGALLLSPFSGLNRAELAYFRDAKLLLRALFIVGGISCILTALRTEPIADVFGAFFVGPVVSYLLAAVFLGERISPLRTLLLLMGFAGVMLVVKPGFGATPGIALALLAGCFYGAYLMMTRAVAGQYRPRFLLVSQLIIGAVVLTPFGATAHWPDAELPVLGLILLSAVGSAMGNYILVIANRVASATVIAPLIYSQLIAATTVGVLVFGEWPDAVALAGLCVIAASGFGTLLVVRRAVH
ncbi:DMT family transporter [Pseudohalocynthiibacter aestuariivivens]|nr:DMT family transporter [Pseudohalocynthiibacter aestuariivivens]QIE46085.1 DMT family transporter [Pseudohalocynthiibacter aestuariivivens]